MRLMYLSASGELGGAETILLDILASVRLAEPAWTLNLVTAAAGPLAARATDLGVTTSVVPYPDALARIGESGAAPGRLLAQLAAAALPVSAYCTRLGTVIQAFDPDVLHTNGLKMHVLGAWACPARTKVIWHLHDYLGTRPTTARLLRWNARRAASVIANSASVAADARVALGGEVTVVPVHNAVDLRRFQPFGDRLDLDALAGMPSAPAGVVRVGLLGTFARWKGHATFLQALARLPAQLPVRGYIIGGALYQTDRSQYSLDELRGLAEHAGLGDRVGFTGFVQNPDAALRALDIVVHASTEPEPFGLVIAQAMACGRAVVVSDAGGAREIISAGIDALAHAPGDATALAARIAELAGDPELRARLGRAGRTTAERSFDRARLAGDLLPIYRRVVAVA